MKSKPPAFTKKREPSSARKGEDQVPRGQVVNFCANNYLGLSSHPEIVQAAQKGLTERGYGMSSVRFICGTQDSHKILEERRISEFPARTTQSSIRVFDANGGLFETLLGPDVVVISDALNHASIIDGVRLCAKPPEKCISTQTCRTLRRGSRRHPSSK